MQIERAAVEEPRRRAVDRTNARDVDRRSVGPDENAREIEFAFGAARAGQTQAQRCERDLDRRHGFGMRAEMIVVADARMRSFPVVVASRERRTALAARASRWAERSPSGRAPALGLSPKRSQDPRPPDQESDRADTLVP